MQSNKQRKKAQNSEICPCAISDVNLDEILQNAIVTVDSSGGGTLVLGASSSGAVMVGSILPMQSKEIGCCYDYRVGSIEVVSAKLHTQNISLPEEVTMERRRTEGN